MLSFNQLVALCVFCCVLGSMDAQEPTASITVSNGTEFLFIRNQTSLINFTTASQSCQELGGALLAIKDEVQQDFINFNLNASVNYQDVNNGFNLSEYRYWVGGFSAKDTGVWLWPDNSTIHCTEPTSNCSEEFANWAAGHPLEHMTPVDRGLTLLTFEYVDDLPQVTVGGSLGEWVDEDTNGLFGYVCQREVCYNKTCLNGGVCQPIFDGFECLCEDGVVWPNCSDPCTNYTCLNGGECHLVAQSIECRCGDDGSVRDDCSITGCFSEPCRNNGTCNSGGSGFNCTCLAGYGGSACSVELDPCDLATCQENSTCQAVNLTSYQCLCPHMYEGVNCTEYNPAEGSVNWALIGGCVGGVVGLLLIAGIVTYFYRRRKTNEPTQGRNEAPTKKNQQERRRNQYVPNPRNINRPLGELSSTVFTEPNQQETDDENYLLPITHYDIDADKLLDKCISMQQENNAVYNSHFRNISAVLSAHDRSQKYVNAAFAADSYPLPINIQLPQATDDRNPNVPAVVKYVLLKSPSPQQGAEYWRSIWKEKCSIVVSFQGVQARSSYIPSSGAKLFGETRVKVAIDEPANYCSKIAYDLHEATPHNSQYEELNPTSRNVVEFKWSEATDMQSILSHPKFYLFLNWLNGSLLSNAGNDVNMAVHYNGAPSELSCFLVFFALLPQLTENKKVAIFTTVADFRSQCDELMTSVDDFIFVHKCLAEAHTLAESSQNVQQIKNRIKQLEKSNRRGYKDEFEQLQKLKKLKSMSRRQLNQNTSPFITFPSTYNQLACYFKGSEFENWGGYSLVLAAKSPSWESLKDFWQCVFHFRCSTIIMLSELEQDGMIHSIKYWPDEGSPETHQNLTVAMVNETRVSSALVKREFKVASAKYQLNVVQLQYTAWKQNEIPTQRNDFDDVIVQLQENYMTLDDSILVHSGERMTRAGTFVSLLSLLEQKNETDIVDVMRTVNDARKLVPEAVNNIDQYAFLYEMMKS